jgi:hypothetical protein
MAQEQPYGISEIYYDTHTYKLTYGLSTYQPIDSNITWSSYTYYMDREWLSRHWVQYWPTKRFGVGTELEFWYTTNQAYQGSEWRLRRVYFTPRFGIQLKLW